MAIAFAVPVRLSTEDLIHFEEALKAHTTAQRDVLRIRIVLLAYQGFTNLEIAGLLGCDFSTVSKWRGRFAQHGRAGLQDQPRSGRPPLFSPLQQACIISLLCQPQVSPDTPTPFDSLATSEIVASSANPEDSRSPNTAMVAALQDGQAFSAAPDMAVAAPSADRQAALVGATETLAASAPFGPGDQDASPTNEALAWTPPQGPDHNVTSVDAHPCSVEMAPGPADTSFAPCQPAANSTQDIKPLPPPKNQGRQRRAKRSAKHQRGHKQAPGPQPGQQGGKTRTSRRKRSKKPSAEHRRFARTQRVAELDLLLGEQSLNRVDLAIVPVVETIDLGPNFPNLQVLTPAAASRAFAAALGVKEESRVLRIEVPLVKATAQELACLEGDLARPALSWVTAMNTFDLALQVACWQPLPPLGQLPLSPLLVSPTVSFDFAPLTAFAEHVVSVKAPTKTASLKRPLGCVLSLEEILERLQEELQLKCSRSTLSRLLGRHELKPWRYQYWIFPEAADFAQRAGPLLDLYAGYWQDVPLGSDEFVLSLDEKTSIQARRRLHETVACAAGRRAPSGGRGRPNRVEWGYNRGGALQYLACWDVHRGKVFGRCEASVGIAAFDRLVDEVMKQEPYASAKRVFAIVDNGSSHRGQKSIDRLEGRYPNLKLVHTPVHASWLNQVEIYFSVIQRALLTPNDFQNLEHLRKAILAFQQDYNERGTSFAWRFTRCKLAVLLKKLEAHKRLA